MVTENLHPTRQVYIFIVQHASITDGDRAAIKRVSDERSGFEAMCWPGTLSPLLLHPCSMAAKLLCSVMADGSRIIIQVWRDADLVSVQNKFEYHYHTIWYEYMIIMPICTILGCLYWRGTSVIASWSNPKDGGKE